MKKLFTSKKRITELVLITALLLFSAVLYLALNGCGTPGSAVIVRIRGEETASYPLSIDGSYPLNGGTNTLVIDKGRAYLTGSDCPDKLCEKQGEIYCTGQCITCLPNRLTVTVIGGEPSGIDAIT